MQIISIGFFYFLLINSADFVLAIVASFGEAANQASAAGGGASNLSPSQIFEAGVNLTKTIWSAISITSPGLSMLLVLAGIIDLYVFSVVAAKLIEVLVESYFCAYAGIVFMGFGASSFTREYATAQFRYGISVGAKRFVLQLIIGLAQGIIIGWANAAEASSATGASPDWKVIAAMIGAPIVMLRLVETLPSRSQDMIMGTSSHSHGSLMATAGAVAAAGVASMVGVAGGGAATKAAFQIASRQIEDRANTSGQSPGAVARAAMTMGYAARNLGNSYASDVGKRLTGQPGARFGRPGFRMAEAMKKNDGKK
jgi:type IV secretion system protein TrbL